MSQQQRFSNTIIAVLAISILLMALISNGLVYRTQPASVIRVQDAIVLDDQTKVGLFVNELMTQRQASCLLWIFNKESHINPKAKNPSSSARGVGQLLESTYRNIGLKHSADPLAQVVASIAYISRHYGSDGACAAKAFWQKHNYY
jgi:Transglycosylase SLT domain